MSATTVPDSPQEELITDAEIVGEDPPAPPVPVPPAAGTELVRTTAPTPALFREYDDPNTTLEVAAKVANTLKDVLAKQGLLTRIGAKDHVDIEGWQTIGTITRVAIDNVHVGPMLDPVTGAALITEYEVHVKDYQWINKEKKHVADRTYTVQGFDWTAKAEARLPDGTLVGTGVGICRRTEDKWAKADDTAMQAMAQTRAASRAYRAALGWVVHLAGYNATPSEEMMTVEHTLPYAQEADPTLKQAASQALLALCGGDAKKAEEAWGAVKKGCGGAMPVAAAQALTAAAALLPQAAAAPVAQAAPAAAQAPVAAAAADPEKLITPATVAKIAAAVVDAQLDDQRVEVLCRCVAKVTSIDQLPRPIGPGFLKVLAAIAKEMPGDNEQVSRCVKLIWERNDTEPLGADLDALLEHITDMAVPF